jgi:hypothetical protein
VLSSNRPLFIASHSTILCQPQGEPDTFPARC